MRNRARTARRALRAPDRPRAPQRPAAPHPAATAPGRRWIPESRPAGTLPPARRNRPAGWRWSPRAHLLHRARISPRRLRWSAPPPRAPLDLPGTAPPRARRKCWCAPPRGTRARAPPEPPPAGGWICRRRRAPGSRANSGPAGCAVPAAARAFRAKAIRWWHAPRAVGARPRDRPPETAADAPGRPRPAL